MINMVYGWLLVTFHIVNFRVVTNNQYGNFCSLAFIGLKNGYFPQ